MQVLFSDESHFEVQGQRSRFVRRSDGEPVRPGHIEQYAKHPEKKMFWGCFSDFGPGRLYPVTGMMNSDTYIKVLQTDLIPERLKVFPNGNGILQQDLATCHTSKNVKKFMVKNNIKTLKWPGNSPDLNPIENLWEIVKKRLRKHDCTTKTKLTTTILQIWIEDTEIQNICKNLVDSMPNSVQKVIAARGGHRKY